MAHTHLRPTRLALGALVMALALVLLVPASASAQTGTCPGGAEPLRWEDEETTMVCPRGVRISLSSNVATKDANSRCEGGRRPLRWEDGATTMVCPGGERIDVELAASRGALANTGLPLGLLALAGAASLGGAWCLRRGART